MSIHIGAAPGDIAGAVLLPGDPLRAKYIAENFLEDAVCYNEVRGMYGFTGMYNGIRVSVQGTGMGVPSISIYVNELIMEYQVTELIRVGHVWQHSAPSACARCDSGNVGFDRFTGQSSLFGEYRLCPHGQF